MANIPIQNITGQQVIDLGSINQPFNSATITINRSGTGGTNPWLNSLTEADTLTVEFAYSTDGGQTWHSLGPQPFTGGSHLVKGVQVPQTNSVGVGIGTPFQPGTSFRVTLTASTPLTFNGSATFE